MKNLSETQIRSAKSDIIPPDELKYMVIEAKNYSDLAFHQLLQGKCLQLDSWIGQVLESREKNDFWMVIFKIDRKGIYVVFDEIHLKEFDLNCFCKYNKFIAVELTQFLEKNIESIKNLSSKGVNVE